MKKKEDLKILYIQIRSDELTRQEEFQEFVRFSGLAEVQFTVINVFDTPVFAADMLSQFDALFIGGSSDDPDDTTKFDPVIYPFIGSLEAIIKYAADNSVPTFASCLGFQVGADVLGGEVIVDKEHMEMGTYDLTLSDEALQDPLFAGLPKIFPVISGHKKRAKTLPPGALLYASTELCPIHCFRLEGKPFYAFQFHPELDSGDLIARIHRYSNKAYFSNQEHVQELIDAVRPVPLANTLLKRFVDVVLLGDVL